MYGQRFVHRGWGGAMGAQPLLDLKIFFSGPNESWTPGKKNNLFLPPGEIPVYTHPGTIPFFFKPTIFKGLENYSHLLLSLRRPPPPFFHIDFRTHLALHPPRKLSSSLRVSPPRFWPSRRTC